MDLDKFANGRTTGVAICKALGLDASRVQRLTISVAPEGFVVCCAGFVMTTSEAGLVCEEIKKYKLVPHSEAEILEKDGGESNVCNL